MNEDTKKIENTNEEPKAELSQRELDKVAGGSGGVSISQIAVTKPIDKASPKLIT